jgi:hypothetical protein
LHALLDLSDHQIAVRGYVLTLFSLLITVLSIAVAWRAIRRSNKNSSAATLVTIYEGFRQAWLRFINIKDDDRGQYELSELMNLVELACAVYEDRSFVGVTKELMRDYLRSSLWLLCDNQAAQERIPVMVDSPDTFKYIRKFLGSRANAQLWERWSLLLRPPTSPIPK